MKISTSLILSVLAVAATIGFTTACENNTRLASKLEGTWNGTPQRMDRTAVDDGTYTPVYRFSRNGKLPEGEIVLTAQLSVTMPVNAPVNAAGTAPVSATCAGLATVSGIWSATDDDEVKIALNPSTLDITLDHDVQFAIADIYTNYDTDSTSHVPQAVMQTFREQMRRAMNDIIAKTHELDDIHFNGTGILSAKIGKTHVNLSKSTD